jgi:hypothetical protein
MKRDGDAPARPLAFDEDLRIHCKLALYSESHGGLISIRDVNASHFLGSEGVQPAYGPVRERGT